MIDLTPLEVRKKKGDFRRVMRGYDGATVDDFLDLVADRLDELVRENMALAERVGRQEQQVTDYRERERALTEALVTAQEMREEIRRQTSQEADLLRRSAEQEASQLRTSATQEAAQLRSVAQQEAAQLRSAAQQETAALKSRTEQELAELRASLRQEREREEEALRALRARQEQFVTTYRSFLEDELNELGGISRALGLTGRGQQGGGRGEAGSPGDTGRAPADGQAGGPEGRNPDGGSAGGGGGTALLATQPVAGSRAPLATGLSALASLTLTETRDPEAPAVAEPQAAEPDDTDHVDYADIAGAAVWGAPADPEPPARDAGAAPDAYGMFPDDDIYTDRQPPAGNVPGGADLLASEEAFLYDDVDAAMTGFLPPEPAAADDAGAPIAFGLDEPEPFEPEPFEPESYDAQTFAHEGMAGPFGLAPDAAEEPEEPEEADEPDAGLAPLDLEAGATPMSGDAAPHADEAAHDGGDELPLFDSYSPPAEEGDVDVNQLLRNAAAAGYSLDEIEDELLLDDDAVVEDEADIDEDDGWLPTLMDDVK